MSLEEIPQPLYKCLRLRQEPKDQATLMTSFFFHFRSLAYEASMAELSAKTPRRETSEAINLFHLRDSLISSGTVCIPSHSVKVCNMERILGNLWHPSKSEVETQDVIKKWHQHLLNID